MSRIGKKLITLESDIKVSLDGKKVGIEGPNGKMELSLPPQVKIILDKSQLTVETIGKDKNNNLQGLYRSLLQNAVTGVKKPWSKTLELVGVGYRAQTTGKELILNLGFSHPINITAPQGISFSVAEDNIIISGVDKYLVGEIAAEIRNMKKPEPYKGKGIRYLGEFIRKKLGKAAKTVGAPGAK